MIYYIHIPKTAGTSVIRIFEKQIYQSRFKRINPTRDIHPKKFLKDAPNYLKGYSPKESSKIDLIAGHFNHGVHKAISETFSYLTILRNPVERVISEYFYMKQMGFFHQSVIMDESLSLEDYLHHKDTYYLNNLQTRMLSGTSYDMGDELNESNYKAALKNLQDLNAVGLTERLPETLALFYLKLKWSRVPVIKSINKNLSRPDTYSIQEECIKKIIEREQFDIRLYHEAEKIFQVSLGKYGEKIQELAHRIVEPMYLYQLYMRSIEGFERVRRKIKRIRVN